MDLTSHLTQRHLTTNFQQKKTTTSTLRRMIPSCKPCGKQDRPLRSLLRVDPLIKHENYQLECLTVVFMTRTNVGRSWIPSNCIQWISYFRHTNVTTSNGHLATLLTRPLTDINIYGLKKGNVGRFRLLQADVVGRLLHGARHLAASTGNVSVAGSAPSSRDVCFWQSWVGVCRVAHFGFSPNDTVRRTKCVSGPISDFGAKLIHLNWNQFKLTRNWIAGAKSSRGNDFKSKIVNQVIQLERNYLKKQKLLRLFISDVSAN